MPEEYKQAVKKGENDTAHAGMMRAQTEAQGYIATQLEIMQIHLHSIEGSIVDRPKAGKISSDAAEKIRRIQEQGQAAAGAFLPCSAGSTIEQCRADQEAALR